MNPTASCRIQRPLAVPAKLRGASELGPPAAPAQKLNEKLELAAKLALLQGVGIVEHEKQICGTFAEEGLGLPVDQVGDVLLKCGQAGRRRNLPLLPQPRGLVVERIDDRGEQETRPVIVELDELAAALGRKMKIPGAEEADFRPSQLRNRRRLAQGRRLPGHADR